MSNTISSNFYFFEKRCAADKSKKTEMAPKLVTRFGEIQRGRTKEILNFSNGTKLLLILVLFLVFCEG